FLNKNLVVSLVHQLWTIIKISFMLNNDVFPVFTKGASIQTLPSLGKHLKGVTECVIGNDIHNHWPSHIYRSSVLQALCRVPLAIPGECCWFLILYQRHGIAKLFVIFEEAIKDPAVRKTIKDVAAEVENTEGRGQLKVSVKPYWGPRFSDLGFPDEFPPQGGPLLDYPVGEYGGPGFGGYSTRQDFPVSGMDRRPFPDDMGHRPARTGDGFGPGGGRDSYGRSGLLEENPGRMYPDGFRGTQMGNSLMDRPVDKPQDRPGLMGAPECSNVSNPLLSYLDTFRIKNESDAQLVLKVTQKLTDLLMEYRLRSGSSLSSLSSVSSTGFSSLPSRLPSSSDRYSTGLSGI
uniref:Uncharacterized protein n=1 Tax=Monopterus albus TaxID=43700 RepID=A0A3Q3IF47_MONAL